MLPNPFLLTIKLARIFTYSSLKNSVFLSMALSMPHILWSQQPAPETSNLARVAIINFNDMTGSQNYNYLSASLASAINTSMQTKFEYVALDPAISAATANEILAKSGKFDSSEANEFCKRTNADILVYGYYTIDPRTNQIVMQTKINFVLINRNVALDPLLNPIDASLFQATDIMASLIVQKIAEMAKKTMSSDSPQSGDGQKISLTKLDEISWSKVNHEINFYGGFAPGAQGKLTSLNSGYLYGVEILRNSDFRKSYAGLTVLAFDQSGGRATHKGWGVMAQFGFNPFTIGNRVRPFAEIDLGYGTSKLSTIRNQTEGSMWLGARAGIKFLVAPRVTFNLDARAFLIFFDVGSWVMSANAGLGFTF